MYGTYGGSVRKPIGTTGKTGEKCPESGIWKVDDRWETTTAPISKGDTFPPYKGKAVIWILIQYA
ncbi:hypothetical protein [Ancylobacter moscoviensis]